MRRLVGQQLSMLPEVAPYPLMNPPLRVICGGCGHEPAVVEGLMARCPECGWHEKVPDPLSPEQLEPPQASLLPLSPEHSFHVGDWVRVKAVQPHQSKKWIGQSGRVVKLTQVRVRVELPKANGEGRIEVPFPADCLERAAHPNRRHSQKGHASGWIEERQGNKKRKTPSTSYFYCWLDEGQRRKRYVPSGKLYRVNQMLDQRRPIKEIVEFLQVQESS